MVRWHFRWFKTQSSHGGACMFQSEGFVSLFRILLYFDWLLWTVAFSKALPEKFVFFGERAFFVNRHDSWAQWDLITLISSSALSLSHPYFVVTLHSLSLSDSWQGCRSLHVLAVCSATVPFCCMYLFVCTFQTAVQTTRPTGKT